MTALNGSDGAGGMAITTQLITTAKIIAPKPAQMTFRARAKPYTSVRTSPKMYETGKKRFPAPNTIGCSKNGSGSAQAFPGPMRFEHSSTATKPPSSRS